VAHPFFLKKIQEKETTREREKSQKLQPFSSSSSSSKQNPATIIIRFSSTAAASAAAFTAVDLTHPFLLLPSASKHNHKGNHKVA
jgi:hypothetical protein